MEGSRIPYESIMFNYLAWIWSTFPWRLRKTYGQWGLWGFPRGIMWNETFKLIMFYFSKFDQGKANLFLWFDSSFHVAVEGWTEPMTAGIKRRERIQRRAQQWHERHASVDSLAVGKGREEEQLSMKLTSLTCQQSSLIASEGPAGQLRETLSQNKRDRGCIPVLSEFSLQH